MMLVSFPFLSFPFPFLSFPFLSPHTLTRFFVLSPFPPRSGYIEIDVDIGSSSIARSMTGMLLRAFDNIACDLGFTLQGQNDGELPERMLGCMRLSKANIDAASLEVDWSSSSSSTAAADEDGGGNGSGDDQ